MWSFKKNIYETRREDCIDCLNQDVNIGTQTWTSCNLSVDKYRDNTPIPEITDPVTWAAATTGAWCYYNFDPANGCTYGRLYNWYAVNDPRGLAPNGYHVATDAEWTTLTTFLGGLSVAGGALKEAGTTHWFSPNTGATNSTGFTALPGGVISMSGNFGNINSTGYIWTSTSAGGGAAYLRRLNSNNTIVDTSPATPYQFGYSVRVIKDACPNCIPHDLPPIGTQTWTGCNADVAFYSNGDPIPYEPNATNWFNATTGAWCWYNNDPVNGPIYGKLYNWYAVNDPRGLAPAGYRVPTDAEWTKLTTFLGGEAVAQGKLKETGLCHWDSPNADATNITGFSALGGGMRYPFGYGSIGQFGGWWTSTILNSSVSLARDIYYDAGNVMSGSTDPNVGMSVRFIKDTFLTCPNVIIGTQTWTACNLNVDQYSDGTPIPQVADYNTWKTLTTGAWTYATTHDSGGTYYKKYYNWYAVAGIYDAASLADPALRKKLAPDGYHVPTTAEWNTLATYLGGLSVAGGELKEVGTTYWATSTGATNSTGFSARGGGYRDVGSGNDNFVNRFNSGEFWTSTPNGTSLANTFVMYHSSPMLQQTNKEVAAGLNVRLVKD